MAGWYILDAVCSFTMSFAVCWFIIYRPLRNLYR